MYNESYHPFTGENLENAIFALPDNYRKEFIEKNDKAIERKERDYYIVLVPPDRGNLEDGTANGLWMHIENGHMTGACYEAIQ